MRNKADTVDGTLGRLARELPRLSTRDAGVLVGRLRAMAIAEGLVPVAELADGLAASLLRDRPGTPVGSWIDAMHEASRFSPDDAGAGPLLLATIGVRLAG